MKKSKIFMVAGAFVLTAAGILATKANRKFKPITAGNLPSSAFLGITGGTSLTFPSVGHFTNVGGGANSAHTVWLALMTYAGLVITKTTIKTSTSPTAGKAFYY